LRLDGFSPYKAVRKRRQEAKLRNKGLDQVLDQVLGSILRRFPMRRFLYCIPLVLIASGALAQTAHEHDACARDVSRFCRAHMSEGDQVVLSCLQQNRQRLSRACEKVLTEHGQ
jgi:hypothetical protein